MSKKTITGYYTTEEELDDKYDLYVELKVTANYAYEAPTMYCRNGDPGDPGYEDINIADIEPDVYWLMDKDGEEVPDGGIYDEYKDVIDAKIKEISDNIDEDDVTWNDPVPDYPDYDEDDF